MEKKINLENLRTELQAQKKAEQERYSKIIKEIEDEITANPDEAKAKRLFSDYRWAEKELAYANEMSIEPIVKAAELFNKMSYELNREFEGTEIDPEAGTIKFPWPGRTINWPVQMLAARYNLHSCGFGFDSSFTTHEARTADNFGLRIGIDPKNDSMVLVAFKEFSLVRI